jgi:5-methylcytosine-specific restriction endonuclease McrA
MGLKKKNKKSHSDKRVESRAHGNARAEQILKIVATDNMFNKVEGYHIGPCIHCGTNLVVEFDGNTSATIEHIVPLSMGGSSSDVLNLALACKRCNNEKGIRHDPNYGRDPRSTEVINNLLERRIKRFHHET